MILNVFEYDDICKAAGREFDVIAFSNDKEKVYLTEDTVWRMLEDLMCEVEVWKEKYQDLLSQIQNDYDPEVEVPQIHGKGISW